jgi:hypothetical protein
LNEHPDVNVRTIYAGQVAAHTGLPVNQLVALAARKSPMPRLQAVRQESNRETAEVVALALLVQQWEEMAPWLIEELFADDTCLSAFRTLAAADGQINLALEMADAEARELIEHIAVLDVEATPDLEARNLISAASRRKLERLVRSGDIHAALEVIEVKHLMERLEDPQLGPAAADELLSWLASADEDGKS